MPDTAHASASAATTVRAKRGGEIDDKREDPSGSVRMLLLRLLAILKFDAWFSVRSLTSFGWRATLATAMATTRRQVMLAGGYVVVAATSGCATASGGQTMYGVIGKALTKPGERDAFIAILLEGTGSMPGCLSYVVAKDPTDASAV